MLIEKLRLEKRNAMISKDVVKKSILEVALGEIQLIEARSNKTPTDDQATNVLRKIIKSNNEVLSVCNENMKIKLDRENEVLNSFLPQVLTQEEIKNLLTSDVDLLDKIKSGKGMASVGVAMKFLKGSNYSVDNNDVVAVVEQLKG